jgi:hypothetical protein
MKRNGLPNGQTMAAADAATAEDRTHTTAGDLSPCATLNIFAVTPGSVRLPTTRWRSSRGSSNAASGPSSLAG